MNMANHNMQKWIRIARQLELNLSMPVCRSLTYETISSTVTSIDTFASTAKNGKAHRCGSLGGAAAVITHISRFATTIVADRIHKTQLQSDYIKRRPHCLPRRSNECNNRRETGTTITAKNRNPWRNAHIISVQTHERMRMTLLRNGLVYPVLQSWQKEPSAWRRQWV